MLRTDGRTPDALRKVDITVDFTETTGGSVLINWGKTRVICTALLEEGTMPFLKDTGKGWLTAEYAMSPPPPAEERKERLLSPTDAARK